MADKTSIEWTEATRVTDRGGRRIRYYFRMDASRPGVQERRARAGMGEAWCRGCKAWMPIGDVRQGACRAHLAAEYRARYAVNPAAIRSRARARKRGVLPMHPLGAEYLTEQFEGRCAYCPDEATTWDHVIPVAQGGDTTPGNTVPACLSCNSSKKDAEVWSWLVLTCRTPNPALLDVLALMEVA